MCKALLIILPTNKNTLINEISVKKLADVDGSFGIYKFTIKQGDKTLSQFSEPITLTFEVDALRSDVNPSIYEDAFLIILSGFSKKRRTG